MTRAHSAAHVKRLAVGDIEVAYTEHGEVRPGPDSRPGGDAPGVLAARAPDTLAFVSMAPYAADEIDRSVRLHVFGRAAETGKIPTPADIAVALERPREEIDGALNRLAAGRVLILAPGTTNIWAANPFSAVPSPFRVEARGRTYWGICIWDALGIAATLHADASIRAVCGDCGELLRLDVKDGALVHAEGVVHFGVPASRWWDNIGFT